MRKGKPTIHSGRRTSILFLTVSVGLLITVAIVSGTCAADRGSGVPLSPEDVCPILTGQKIPAATLKTIEGKPFDLTDAIAKKPTILIFYRGGW